MKKLHVRLYADSLALPRLSSVDLEQRYINLLQNFWEEQSKKTFIIDRAKGGATITEQVSVYRQDNFYFGSNGDILIIHLGICDCSPRPVPYLIRKLISRLPSLMRNKIVKFLHNNRSKILRLGSSWQLTNRKVFEKVLADWLKDSVKNYNRVYIINIAPTNPEFENHSPGWMKSISEYNGIIDKVIGGISNNNIHLIDFYKLIMDDYLCIDKYILKVDGHHLTPTSHYLIAEKIMELEKRYNKDEL